jgi:hypothetical protein
MIFIGDKKDRTTAQLQATNSPRCNSEFSVERKEP